MTEEKAAIFFVAQGCSFCAKCHTVNVKGGEESWDWQRGSLITLPPVSSPSSSHLLCLFRILKRAVGFFSCCFWSSSVPAFWLPPTSCPEARIYLSICMQEHMLACAHTHTHSSSPHPFIHTAQLPLYACFKEITEASKKRERIYLCASAPIIQYLHYAFRETNPCCTGNAPRAPAIEVSISETGMHYKPYIYFTLI